MARRWSWENGIGGHYASERWQQRAPIDKPPLEERRKAGPKVRHGGRRWKDDPDLAAAVERLQLTVSRQAHGIRALREWSQDDMAHVAGVSPQTVLDVESMGVDVHLSTLVRLAYAAGFEVDIRFRRARSRALYPTGIGQIAAQT